MIQLTNSSVESVIYPFFFLNKGVLGFRPELVAWDMAVPAEMAKAEGGDASTIRIYVGGLGECVTAEDLKKTFSTPQLGKVESMDIVRTKGRSFAYLELLPSSDKSLAKLFSTYNGCMWKGGRLRIEKAKEHFFLRLKREWEEDAALATTSAHLPDTEEVSHLAATAAEMTKSLKYQKKGSKMDEMQLRMYFPKLGKLKSVPFRGTGKHKYSFQRVEVPSLPIHFCDCEEHSGPPDTTKQKSFCDYDSKNGGMDEKELNIMNSVLNKIFEREKYSQQDPRDFKLSKEVRSSNVTVDHLKNDKNLVNQEMEDDDNLILNVVAGANDRATVLKDPTQEAMTATQDNENSVDQEMDEDDDNLIINVVAGANDKTTMFKDPTQEAIAAIQNSLSKESQLATDKQRQGRKMSSNRKRKAPSENEDGEAHTLPSKPEAKRKAHSGNSSATFPKKSPWKDLVSTSSGATFSVSDILPSAIPGKEMRSGSEGVSVSSDKKDEKVSYQHDKKDLASASSGATSNVSDILPSDIPGKEMRSTSEGVSVSSDKKDEKVSDQHDKKDLVSASSGAMFSVSDILPSAIPGKEMQSGSEGVGEKDEKVSNQHEELGKVAEDSTDNVDAPVDLYARGAAWRQKLSWTELVRDTTRSSFSISQFFPKPELAVMGETLKMQKSSSTGKSDFQHISTSEEGTKADALSVPGIGNGGTIVEEQKNVHLSKELPHLENYQQKEEVMNEGLAPTPEKKHVSAPKQEFVGDTSFSDTCSFMRSAASMKEWTKTKAALSGSLKKKANDKK
ncbi:uncharacterized protein LOC107760342 [Nicotiana tabacum]|uniref:Uncharacterized protein LOC107760342 n=1 Tax=Nicotiana tabacum TaxID=4097 RepID=A0A1S3X2E1_TOBAC|nr:PREDICTED: uncharacterized protein LOC107760342 [Nicotiana tabacum]